MTIAIIIYIGVCMLICFRAYKWSEKGINSLFKIRRRNQLDKKYLESEYGKVLQFRRRELIIKDTTSQRKD